MTITHVRIHPAIGIARVGDSPDEFFYGPERPYELPLPDGSFKDTRCRIKRQAARFRVFAYHDAGPPTELTSADGDITWSVHVANTKKGEFGIGSNIDSGKHSIASSAPNQRVELAGTWKTETFSTSVKLGEAWADDNGRLVFLGGSGAAGHAPGAGGPPDGWYDDVCDGPITAKVALKDGSSFSAENGAWVVSAPPKFAPHLNSIVTLYDYLYDFAVTQGWIVPPAQPSYTEHIYPILQRAQDVYFLTGIDAHNQWVHPVSDNGKIFKRLRPPHGLATSKQTMPKLDGPLTLTPTQYGWMQKWADSQFVQDWVSPPEPVEITPDGLDRAALEACVGGAFQPGIEVGGGTLQNPTFLVGAADPLRVRNDQAPGLLTGGLNVTWHTDLYACGSYWPVARPTSVFATAGGVSEAWTDVSRDDFIDHWSASRFIVKQGDQYLALDCVGPPNRIAQIYAQIIFGILEDGGGVDSIHGRVPPRVDRGQRDALRAIALAVLARDVETPQMSTSLQEHALRSATAALNDAISGLRTGRRST